ncbi:lmo0937 family membrane protein [Planctomycetales bacterium ZRK34]|nr:lmo0937 family membrane protein [Planctomycetales bacterium ZRK34]
MLWTLALLFVLLWLLGLITSYTFGGVIHLLLVAAVVVLVIQLIQKRKLST